MTIFLRALIAASLLIAPNISLAQSQENLNRLFQAVWEISLQQAPTIEGFEQEVAESFATASILDNTKKLGEGDWESLGHFYVAKPSVYRDADSIKCAFVNEKGIARFTQLQASYGDKAVRHMPREFEGLFLLFGRKDILTNDVVSLHSCSGAFHLTDELVDVNSWNKWYDTLETHFSDAGLSVSRRPSAAIDTYAAGFLSGEGKFCRDKKCIRLAQPWNTLIKGLNAHQAVIFVTSTGHK